MENKKIILPNKKYIGSPDKDVQIKINLESSNKNSLEGSYNYTINANEQYTTERQNSTLFRPYLKISNIYYSNGTQDPFINNYFKNYLPYSVNRINDSPLLSNVDLLYDPIKTLLNDSFSQNNSNVKSSIFSLTAPYDDIIITNISSLTNGDYNQYEYDLLEYWYLPTDIKKDGSYTATTWVNNPGELVIVSASTGWINIGTFRKGDYNVDFNNTNVIQTPLFTFRGNMNIKIPKYHTYSFFVNATRGTSNPLKTTTGDQSIAGFMKLPPDTYPNGDIIDPRNYQQYCWLNIWPDSYEEDYGSPENNRVYYRDYYGWYNLSSATESEYVFKSTSIITGSTTPYAFKGVVNYKLIQREPYRYRTQRLLKYDDYYDSIVPGKTDLEFIKNINKNWDMYSAYSYSKDNNINFIIEESGITNTFTISNGIPAVYNKNLTENQISSSTNTVFSSYMTHNLSIGNYVQLYSVSGLTTTNLGVFPVVSIGNNNNENSKKLFTIKISGFTGNYFQFKRVLTPSDNGSISKYYVRKYKIIEDIDNYNIFTPLSKNSFSNPHYYLTNKSEVDISGLNDENGIPITSISYLFKKKDIINNNEGIKLKKVKNTFYDEYYAGRNGFIGRELYNDIKNYFIDATNNHPSGYINQIMASGLTNTYRDNSITPDNTILYDDTTIFEVIGLSDSSILNLSDHIVFTDFYDDYVNMSALTQSVVYRKGDDFNYDSNKYISLFSQYSKKPISKISGNTLSLLGVKPTLTDYGSSQIAGSTLYPGNSMVYIGNQLSNFPIGGTLYFATGSTDSLTSATILNYELGGLYAVISGTTYGNLPTTGYTNLYTLQYYGDTYNIRRSDLEFEHFASYMIGGYETNISIGSINIGDPIYGDVAEYNERELETYSILKPQYLFKLKDLYGELFSVTYSAKTSTFAKSDLLYPVTLRYLTNIIYSSNNVEDKKNWAVFNDKLNIWQWREFIPNGDIDESGRGTNFPFLSGRHYVYNEFLLPFRSKYWDPINGNQLGLKYNFNNNLSSGVGDIGAIEDLEFC
jgi:hypothetical protein